MAEFILSKLKYRLRQFSLINNCKHAYAFCGVEKAIRDRLLRDSVNESSKHFTILYYIYYIYIIVNIL